MTKDVDLIGQLASRTITLLGTEYPNGIRLSMNGPIDEPIRPSAIYPAFYGCYDWHSAVHSHWQLVRAVRSQPDASFVDAATAFLDQSLTARNISVEMQWVAERPNFEMPYGMAWLLMLCAELHEWGSDNAQQWLTALRPMQQHAYERFHRYCERLALPVRGGMHGQSAFSLGLVRDAAIITDRADIQQLVDETARRLYLADLSVNLAYEPSAADFLSPSLAEADLLARVLDPAEFSRWLDGFAPDGFSALTPVEVVDPSDGQLAHWAGLNLSRAWMLHNIADVLTDGHSNYASLGKTAEQHAQIGMPIAAHPEYMVSHWVPTFAVYLLTRR